MSGLKILHLCSARQFVGEAARVIDLSEKMRELGHHSEIIVREKFSLTEQCSRRNIPYTSVWFKSKFNPITDYNDIRTIRERIFHFKPDIVHAHRGKEHWLAAAALSGMRHRLPLVRTRHVVTKIKPHLANKWLFRKATDGLICVSKAVHNEVSKFGTIGCPIKTITGGLNQNRFVQPDDKSIAKFRDRMHIPENRIVISCLARLAPVKGQEYILRAIPEVIKEHPNAIFLFVYPRQSDYRQKLDYIIRQLDIGPHVNFIGPIDNLSLFFSITDLGLLSSIGSEGWSRATVEFMYHGIPVIGTNVGCISEIIKDNINGFVVEPKNSHAMAEAIKTILSNAENFKKLGSSAREIAANKHTVDSTAESVLDFYHELLKRKTGGVK
ncbi:MAG: glycosyltransferase family 4 protein [Planctomycetota bacterium]|jgi:glycosyltransferase involved in cell wall biosynthesis